MIIGVGVDIVDVNRIEKLVSRFGNRFSRKILSPVEVETGLTDRRLVNYLAKQFAAKEAVSKALGIGMRCGVGFTTIRILRGQHGAPYVELGNRAAERARQIGVDNIQISLSDERDYAIAYAVASSN